MEVDARLPLSALSGTSTLCLGLLFGSQLRKRDLLRAQNEEGEQKGGSEQRYYARMVYHTKRMKGRGLSWLRYAHTTDTERQNRGHGISDVLF